MRVTLLHFLLRQGGAQPVVAVHLFCYAAAVVQGAACRGARQRFATCMFEIVVGNAAWGKGVRRGQRGTGGVVAAASLPLVDSQGAAHAR